eukprot:2705696-Rhodomonas_salina.2
MIRERERERGSDRGLAPRGAGAEEAVHVQAQLQPCPPLARAPLQLHLHCAVAPALCCSALGDERLDGDGPCPELGAPLVQPVRVCLPRRLPQRPLPMPAPVSSPPTNVWLADARFESKDCRGPSSLPLPSKKDREREKERARERGSEREREKEREGERDARSDTQSDTQRERERERGRERRDLYGASGEELCPVGVPDARRRRLRTPHSPLVSPNMACPSHLSAHAS